MSLITLFGYVVLGAAGVVAGLAAALGCVVIASVIMRGRPWR